MLEVIIGPMFSGKTTYLFHRAEAASYIGKVLYINHSLDTRNPNDGGIVSTHNKTINIGNKKFDAIKTHDLGLFDDKFYSEYATIFIDEAHFFKELYPHVRHLIDDLKIDVHVAGLSGTSNRIPFPETDFLSLISLATHVELLKSAYCYKCASNSVKQIAHYTFRHSSDKSSDILVGGSEKFSPVCGECWNKLQ